MEDGRTDGEKSNKDGRMYGCGSLRPLNKHPLLVSTTNKFGVNKT
jgi:hypothetical protein